MNGTYTPDKITDIKIYPQDVIKFTGQEIHLNAPNLELYKLNDNYPRVAAIDFDVTIISETEFHNQKMIIMQRQIQVEDKAVTEDYFLSQKDFVQGINNGSITLKDKCLSDVVGRQAEIQLTKAPAPLAPVERLPDSDNFPKKGDALEINTNFVKVYKFGNNSDKAPITAGKVKLEVTLIGPNYIFFKIPNSNQEFYIDKAVYLSVISQDEQTGDEEQRKIRKLEPENTQAEALKSRSEELKAMKGKRVNFKSIEASKIQNGDKTPTPYKGKLKGEIINITTDKICIKTDKGALYAVNISDLPEDFGKVNKLSVIPEGYVVKIKSKGIPAILNAGTETTIIAEEELKGVVTYSSERLLSIQKVSGETYLFQAANVKNLDYEIVEEIGNEHILSQLSLDNSVTYQDKTGKKIIGTISRIDQDKKVINITSDNNDISQISFKEFSIGGCILNDVELQIDDIENMTVNQKEVAKKIATKNVEILQQEVYNITRIEVNITATQKKLLDVKAAHQEDKINKKEYEVKINEIFEELIKTTFKSIGETFLDVDISQVTSDGNSFKFAKEGWAIMSERLDIDVWADHFLDYIGKNALPKAIGLLKDVCIQNGITNLNLDDWIGPQGVGKGTLLLTLRDVANKVKAEEILVDDTLMQLFNEISNPNTDTIETGTGENGGIFNPDWRIKQGKGELANLRYLPWISLGKAAGIPVGMGKLLSDNFTNLVAVIELSRSIALGMNRVSVDVWPRTKGQGDFVNGELVTKLAEENIKVSPSLLHVEAVNKEIADLIMSNIEVSKRVYKFLGSKLKAIVKDPTILKQGFVGNVFKLLEMDQNDKVTIKQNEEQIKKVGSAMLNDFRDLLIPYLLSADNMLELTKDMNDDDKNIALKIYTALADGRGTSIKQIADRFAQIMREDEGDVAAIAKRLASYDSDSAPAARDMGAIVVPGKGTPSEAIEAMLTAMVLEKKPDYDITCDGFIKIVAMAKGIHETRVNIRKQTSP